MSITRRFFFAASAFLASRLEAGGDHRLHEHLGQRARGRGVHAPVEGDDAAEGGDRVAGPGAREGLLRARAHRRAAGVRVLDDHAGRLVDLGDQPPGRVQVEDVVERELLALHLARGGHRVEGRPEVAVEGRALVRVLAVAQVLHLLEARARGDTGTTSSARRDRVAAVAAPPPGRSSRRWPPRSARCGGRPSARGRGGWRRPGRPCGRAARAAAGSRRDPPPPPRRGSSWPPRAAWSGPPMSMFSTASSKARALRHLVLEGIEVHHHHVDGGDAVLLQRLDVRGHAAPGQDAAVDLRVQGLHAAVEDLREAGHVRDRRSP